MTLVKLYMHNVRRCAIIRSKARLAFEFVLAYWELASKDEVEMTYPFQEIVCEPRSSLASPVSCGIERSAHPFLLTAMHRPQPSRNSYSLQAHLIQIVHTFEAI